MNLKELCEAAQISCPIGEETREITSLAMDSRTALAGGMFICIVGLHTNGHTYIADAVANGACCILTQRGQLFEKIANVIYLEADDTRRASSRLYHAFYGYPSRRLKIIGVTGTNGKTSVTHMLRAILEASLFKCGLVGTLGCASGERWLDGRSQNPNANMTTPDPPQLYPMLARMVEDGVEYVLMEVTSHALALGKLDPIEFEAAIFTNLTPEHLDFHGTMENYATAKAELFSKSKLSLINVDSPYADQMIARASGTVITCGTQKKADHTAEDVESLGERGVSYTLRSASASLRIFCPVSGAFSVINSMQAAIIAQRLGVASRALQDALSCFSGVPGRMERVRLGLDADMTVLIDYAHTPDALENLLRTAKKLCSDGGKLTVLFGCGGERDRTKRPIMGKIASQYADSVIVTSDNSRGEDPQQIIHEILAGILPQTDLRVIPDRAEAIAYAVEHAERGDWLLLAGKGHEEYEINRSGRVPFFEKEIVQQAFQNRKRQQRNTQDGTENSL